MLVVDTGPLVAAADIGDRDHQACLRLLGTAQGPLVVSPLVVAEAAYLIGRQLGSQFEAEFFRSISDGELLMESLTPADLVRMAELVETYADLGLGGTASWDVRCRSSRWSLRSPRVSMNQKHSKSSCIYIDGSLCWADGLGDQRH